MEADDGSRANWIATSGSPETFPDLGERRFVALELDPLKMYCIVSREAFKTMKRKGSDGKPHAQSGHAWLHAYWDAEKRFPEEASAYRASNHAYKITLRVDDEEALKAIYEAHTGICGSTLVEDAGFTVFTQPTITCVGLGPVRRSQLVAGVGDLKAF